MALVSGHSALMWGLSAIANLSSNTRTPAKLVEYAQAAAPARINAATIVAGTLSVARGGCAPSRCDRLCVRPGRFFEVTIKSLRPPEDRLVLFARVPTRGCRTRAARGRATTQESPSVGR